MLCWGSPKVPRMRLCARWLRATRQPSDHCRPAAEIIHLSNARMASINNAWEIIRRERGFDVTRGNEKQAALKALDEVENGMKLGLGTGSTARYFVDGLGEKVRAGLEVVCVLPQRRHCAGRKPTFWRIWAS